MSLFPIDITHIRAVLFDIDGVLSRVTTQLDADGLPQRTVNVRDGYAIREALRRGIELGIISGGYSESIPKRYGALGVKYIYMGTVFKNDALDDFLGKTGLRAEECLFCGDDIPDMPVMKRCGFSVAPQDAAPEVKSIAKHVLPVRGGRRCRPSGIGGVAKDEGLWLQDEHAFGW